MINIIDKVYQYMGRYQLTLVSGTTYDLTRVKGTVTAEGTDLNRATLMAMQGFHSNNVSISADGYTITETNAQGHTKVTVISNGGLTITETFTAGTQVMTKTTTIDSVNKTISEVVS